MDEVRYLIVGAGVSGLSFANWARDDDYLICEQSESIGGYCKTILQDGFTWDYSGHFFHFRHPQIEEYLTSRMTDQNILRVEKRSSIYMDGQYVDFPFQKNIHQLSKKEFIRCLVDLYLRHEDFPDEPTNFRDMLYRKFGRGIADMFLVPYNEKLYATDLGTLDVDAMGRFFPYADFDDVIRNIREADNRSYNTTFTYPEGGAIQYIYALAQGLNANQISLNEPVLTIDLKRKVARTSKREIRFDILVSSAPFPRLLSMCGLDHDSTIYSSNAVEVFNLGFDRKGSKENHWIYFPQPELSFYRIGFYDNIFGSDRMSLYVEIGRSSGFESTEIERTRDRVLADLEQVGIVTDHQLISSHYVVLDPAYVHITQAGLADVSKKKQILKQHGVYSIGRYGSWTYCSIEDNIVEAQELARSMPTG